MVELARPILRFHRVFVSHFRSAAIDRRFLRRRHRRHGWISSPRRPICPILRGGRKGQTPFDTTAPWVCGKSRRAYNQSPGVAVGRIAVTLRRRRLGWRFPVSPTSDLIAPGGDSWFTVSGRTITNIGSNWRVQICPRRLYRISAFCCSAPCAVRAVRGKHWTSRCVAFHWVPPLAGVGR